MPSLIGSAPNQVPTNGMLGTMAFQDADNASVATKAVTDNSTFPASTAFVKSAFDARNEILTTTGTSAAYSITPTIPELTYQNGDVWNIKFHTTSGVSPTLAVSGLSAKPIVFQQEDGSYSAGLPTSALQTSFTSRVRYDSSLDKFVLLDRPLSTDTEATGGVSRLSNITPYSLRKGLNASGPAPIYACRAWVNFNGTLASGDLRRASGNVSSVTDLGTGDYRITFTTELPSSDYAAVTAGSTTAFANSAALLYINEAPTTTTVRVRGCSSGANAIDMATISVSVFV